MFFELLLIVCTQKPVAKEDKHQGKKIPKRNLTLCFLPESYELFILAGLLACLVLMPSHFNFRRNSGLVYQNILNRLTAAGTAPDFLRE